jgi:FtsP/CotA-like multicopper oxidase with cupredoxin domain
MMKRRRFLQLAASATAGALVEHSSAWSCSVSRFSLRMAPLSVETTPGSVIDATVVALVGEPVLTRATIDALSQSMREPTGFDASFSASARPLPKPDQSRNQVIETLLEKSLDRHDGNYHWIVNGRRFADIEPLLLQWGQRYRLRMLNATAWPHPIHLQHHSFELTRINQIPVSGIFKDTIRLERYNVIEADVVVRHRGLSVL